VAAERKARDPTAGSKQVEAAAKVGAEPGGALITVLRRLLQELHHDVGDRFGDSCRDGGEGRGLARNVKMHELEGILAFVQNAAAEVLVQRDAERVPVGAVVDAVIHPAGLLRRDIRERAFERRRESELAFLAAQTRSNAEVDEFCAARSG